MNQTTTTQPLAVSEGAKQDGEIYDRWSWVEVAVWTPRMLTALETGVKGVLHDVARHPETMKRAGVCYAWFPAEEGRFFIETTSS